MEPENADRLIKRIWDIKKQLHTMQSALTAIEYAIADETPDER